MPETKRIVLLLLVVVPCLLRAQLKVIEIKLGTDINGSTFSFPLVKSSNTALAEKINSFLQNDILANEKILTDSNEIFENSRFIHSDSNWQSGYSSIDYTVEQNSATVFSLSFYFESTGAYAEYYNHAYNFSLQSGDLLTAENLFTESGFMQVSDLLIKERSKRIAKWLTEMDTTDQNPDDSTYIRETFAECSADAAINSFVIKTTGIEFYKQHCFPHAARAFDIDLDVEFTYKEIAPYLSGKGQRLLAPAK